MAVSDGVRGSVWGQTMNDLQKALFQRLERYDFSRAAAEMEVQFNPTEFTLNKGVQLAEIAIPGLDMPILQYVHGQTETLSLELFFDTTDSGMGETAQSVTEQTDRFYQLIKIDPESHAPPVCRFVWGAVNFPGLRYLTAGRRKIAPMASNAW